MDLESRGNARHGHRLPCQAAGLLSLLAQADAQPSVDSSWRHVNVSQRYSTITIAGHTPAASRSTLQLSSAITVGQLTPV